MFKAVHVPSRTVTSISAETVIELSQIDNIVELKEAGGDLGQAAIILDGTNKDFLLYSGGDGDTFPVKHALNYVGFPVGEPRLPLSVPDEKSAAIIEAVVKKYHISLPFYS
jgi:dihydrodipicolinate synthase/N-acetylneuraminate lyase